MHKIIAGFDGLKFSESTRDYSIFLAGLCNAHLSGIFLDDLTYSSYKLYDLITGEGIPESKLKKSEEKDKATRSKAALNFENTCQKEGLNYSIHHDRKIALHELLHESIFADILVIDSKETLTHYEEPLPTPFIRELLTHAQCPVVLAPSKYKPIEKIVLLYDGEPSSLHAIKMFSYTLPALKALPTEVISVKGLNSDLHLPDNKLMKEFMKKHFPRATFKIFKGQTELEITRYIKEQTKNPLIILGAYKRGIVSRWLKASLADTLMKDLKIPLFIAHNK
jgi:hypothetical protein